jgi:hypothetical protein
MTSGKRNVQVRSSVQRHVSFAGGRRFRVSRVGAVAVLVVAAVWLLSSVFAGAAFPGGKTADHPLRAQAGVPGGFQTGTYDETRSCVQGCGGTFYVAWDIKNYDPATGSVTGTFLGRNPGEIGTLAGTVLNGQVHLTFADTAAGYTNYRATLVGTNDGGGKLHGTFTDNEGHSGTWTAVRRGTAPPDFDPTGKYNLFIFCTNSPCSVFAAKDSGVPRSGFAFGEMGISVFDPSTGSLGGLVTALHVTITEPAGFSNQGFGISGTIANGKVELNFKPLPLVADLSAFSLTGQVIDSLCDPTGCYRLDFGGSIGSTDVWVACFQQQRSCVPPDTSNNGAKWLAKACDAGSLASLAGVVSAEVAPAFVLCGAIFSIIGLFDPPDPHYKHVTGAPRISGFRVPAGHGLSGSAAAAATQVVTALAQTAATGAAFLDAYQRFQGAARATDPKWLGPQYLATLKYGHALAAQTRHAAAILAAERIILTSSPLGRSRISPQALDRQLRYVRSHGWPSGVAKLLSQWGISASELRATLKLIPTTAPADARTPLGPILDPSFAAHLRAYADGLDRYLAAFAKRPFR